MLRGVFFDLDGTLIADRDTEGRRTALAAAWREAFGQPVEPEALEAAIQTAYEAQFLYGQAGYADLAHLGMRDFLARLLDGMRAVLSVPNVAETTPFLLAWSEIEWQALALVPGAVSVLGALREAGLTLGLITNGPSCLQREKLDLLDLTPHLDHILVDTSSAARSRIGASSTAPPRSPASRPQSCSSSATRRPPTSRAPSLPAGRPSGSTPTTRRIPRICRRPTRRSTRSPACCRYRRSSPPSGLGSALFSSTVT